MLHYSKQHNVDFTYVVVYINYIYKKALVLKRENTDKLKIQPQSSWFA